MNDQPLRGSFDYLLDPIRDQLQPPPPPLKRGEGGGPQRIHREITERRAAKGDIIVLIVLALLAWGIGLFAVAWGLAG